MKNNPKKKHRQDNAILSEKSREYQAYRQGLIQPGSAGNSLGEGKKYQQGQALGYEAPKPKQIPAPEPKSIQGAAFRPSMVSDPSQGRGEGLLETMEKNQAIREGRKLLEQKHEKDQAVREMADKPGGYDFQTWYGTQDTPGLEQEFHQREEEARKADEALDQEKGRRQIAQDCKSVAQWPQEDKQLLIDYLTGKNRRQRMGSEDWYLLPDTDPAEEALEKKYGREILDKMAYLYSYQKNLERSAQTVEQARASSQGFWGGLGNWALSFPANLAGDLLAPIGRIQDERKRPEGYPQNPQLSTDLPHLYAETVRETVGENIRDSVGGVGGDALGLLYQGVTSVGDTAARAALGGRYGSLALAGSGSYSQAIRQAIAQGATPEQAQKYAIGKAGIEVATEFLPTDQLFKAAKGGIPGLKGVLAEGLKQAGSEATSEEISLLAGLVWEANILRDKSAYQQQVADAIANGASAEQAKAMADKAVLQEALSTALVSGFSGGVSGLGSSATGYFRGKAADTANPGSPDVTTPGSLEEGVMEPEALTPEQIQEQAVNQLGLELAKTTPQAAPDPVQQKLQAAANETFDKLGLGPKEKTVDTPQGVGEDTPVTAQPERAQGIQQEGSPDGEAEIREGENRGYHPGSAGREGTEAVGKPGERSPAVSEEGTHPEGSGTDFQGGPSPEVTEPKGDSPFREGTQPMPHGMTEDSSTGTASRNVQEADPQDPGIQGTGAAERNFTGKAAYQDLLHEGNVQPDRPGDVRPMEIPKKDSYGREVSEFVADAYGAAVTTDRMANVIESLVQEGALGFDRKGNREALEEARKAIYGDGTTKGKGEASVKKSITKNVADGKLQDGDIEKAMLLYAQYAGRKSLSSQENAAELMVDLTTMFHMSGRNLQLAKLFRRLTPEGQLMTVKKTVERKAEAMKDAGLVKKDFEPQIPPEMESDYMDAAREAEKAKDPKAKADAEKKRKENEDAIYAYAAAQMPSTFKAKWDAWRYMCMLGNAKTQVRNVVGNLSFVPFKVVKDQLGAMAEKILLPQDQRTKTVFQDPRLVAWAFQDASTQQVHDALSYSARLGDDVTSQKMSGDRVVFKHKFLEVPRKFIEKVPELGDMIFKNPYYAASLAGFVQARGYTAEDARAGTIPEPVLDEGRNYAIQEAMKATFNDCNAFSDFLATELRYKGKNTFGKIANLVGEGALPFRRTPANIIVRFVEYSPVGILKSGIDAGTKVRSGEMTAAAAIDELCAGLTGSGLFVLGYFLSKGIGGLKITGSDVDEDEKRQGHQPYALEFSVDGKNYSYTIDWAAPANLPLFVGANLQKMLEKNGEDTEVSKLTKFIRACGNAFEPMLQLSCLSSLNDVAESVRYAEKGEAIYTVASNITLGYLMQGIPSLSRQYSQSLQKNKKMTYANNPDPTFRDLERIASRIPWTEENRPFNRWLNKSFNRISPDGEVKTGGARFPWADPHVRVDRISPWGEAEENGGALSELTGLPTWMTRATDAFVNPGSLKVIDDSPLEQEITRLNHAQEINVSPPDVPKVTSWTDTQGQFHDNQRLTWEQHQIYAQEQGQIMAKLRTEAIKSPIYPKLSDVQKAEVMKKLQEYAVEEARKKALPDYLSREEDWMEGIRTGGAWAAVEQVAGGSLESAVKAVARDLEQGWDTQANGKWMEEAIEAIQGLPPAAQKAVTEDLEGHAAKYAQVHGQISTQKYMDVLKDILALGEDSTDTDRYRAIAENGSLSDPEKDIVMGAYLRGTNKEKYSHARNELGMSPEEFVQAREAYSSYTSGEGKKGRTVEHYAKLYGLTQEEAEELYDMLAGKFKPWEE